VVGDYTPYVQEVLATKPDIIFSLGVSSDYIGLAKALQAAQYQGMYTVPAADPQLAPILGASYAQTNWGPNEAAATTPAIQQMLDDFEAYKPGTKAKIAFIGPDNERAKFAIAGFYASATANGLDVVYAKASTPPPPAVVGDYTPYVQEVLATNPDIIFSLGVSSDYIGLAKALQAAQYKGMYVIPAADPQLAPIVGASYAQTNWGPNEAASTTPAIQQMLDDFEAYKPGTVPGNAMVIGWLSADHFIAALKKAGKDLTTEKLQQAASKMTYEQKGLIGPTPYPKNRVATTPNCHAFLKTDGKTYTIVENYACVSKRYKIPSYDSIETG